MTSLLNGVYASAAARGLAPFSCDSVQPGRSPRQRRPAPLQERPTVRGSSRPTRWPARGGLQSASRTPAQPPDTRSPVPPTRRGRDCGTPPRYMAPLGGRVRAMTVGQRQAGAAAAQADEILPQPPGQRRGFRQWNHFVLVLVQDGRVVLRGRSRFACPEPGRRDRRKKSEGQGHLRPLPPRSTPVEAHGSGPGEASVGLEDGSGTAEVFTRSARLRLTDRKMNPMPPATSSMPTKSKS